MTDGLNTNSKELTTHNNTFYKIAKYEYDSLVSYCNILGEISNVINGKNQWTSNVSSNSYVDLRNDVDGQLRNNLVHDVLQNDLERKKRSIIENSLSCYNLALEKLRTAHIKLVDYVSMEKNKEREYKVQIMMNEHVILSERVLNTCSSSSIHGPGPFYTNGILKNLSCSEASDDKGWHEARLVGLSSLKESIWRVSGYIDSLLRKCETYFNI